MVESLCQRREGAHIICSYIAIMRSNLVYLKGVYEELPYYALF